MWNYGNENDRLLLLVLAYSKRQLDLAEYTLCMNLVKSKAKNSFDLLPDAVASATQTALLPTNVEEGASLKDSALRRSLLTDAYRMQWADEVQVPVA